jgi:hypothetical protein
MTLCDHGSHFASKQMVELLMAACGLQPIEDLQYFGVSGFDIVMTPPQSHKKAPLDRDLFDKRRALPGLV